MEMSADALQSTLNEIFTSLKLEEGEEQEAEGGDDTDTENGDAAGGENGSNTEKTADGSAGDGDKPTSDKKSNRRQVIKKPEDPTYKSVTTVSTGECTLDVEFHGIIPESMEHLRHKKLRATFSFVPSVGGKEGTLVIMKSVNNEPQVTSEEKDKKAHDFPTNMEYLVRRQPHDYPKLYMEPLTEIEVGVLMSYPRETYRPLSLSVGWLHWKSGRFRAQDPHNHIPITGLDGSCVDAREIYREVTRQFSLYCQTHRVRTISFRSDQEVFFALGFYADSRDPKYFIRRLVDDAGNVLTLYQFLLLHDSLQPGRKRLYVWTATRRKGQRRPQPTSK